MSLFAELNRRNVIRMGGLYLVAGWLVVQVAETLLPLYDTPAWVLKTIILLLAIGFVPALIFAWIFEVTPAGIKRDGEVTPSQSIAPLTGKRMNRVIMALLVIALGYFAVDKFVLAPGRGIATTANAPAPPSDSQGAKEPMISDKSIAVLPFSSLSSGEDDGLFADGLSEEIINSLARVPDLQVAARSSSFALRGMALSAPEAAAKLHVAHVLEGSIRRSGDRLRITAQLIRADGFTVWSENYDRSNQDLISIQENVAGSIAKALKTVTDPASLARMQQVGTRSVAAYDAFLKAIALEGKSGESGDFELSVGAAEAIDQAIELDPEFAEAHRAAVSIAMTELDPTQQNAFSVVNTSYASRMQKFRQRLEEAITASRDPALSSYYESLEASIELRFVDAMRLLDVYLKAYPEDSAAINRAAELAMITHDFVRLRGLSEQLHAKRNESVGDALQGMVYMSRLPDKARSLQMARESLRRYPDHFGLAYQAHRVMLLAGEVREAAALVPKLISAEMPVENKLLVEMRQACAEGRRPDAEAAFSRINPDDDMYGANIQIYWNGNLLLGRTQEATNLVAQLDRPEFLSSLAPFLQYPEFDAGALPNLRAALEAQGIEVLPRRPESYACGPASEDP